MSENFMKIYRGLSFEPSTSDPVSPLEGDMFFADALHPTRDEGFWQYKDGDWEQFGTGGGGGAVAITRAQATSQTGTTVTFPDPYTLGFKTQFFRNGVLMDEVTSFSGGVSNAEEYQEDTNLTITLNASDPATVDEVFEFIQFDNTITDTALYDARGDADGSLTEDCTISTVLGKTRVVLDLPFTYTAGRNPGGAYGDIAVYVNGQRIERKISGINDGVGNIIYDEVDPSTVDVYIVTGVSTSDPIPAGTIINLSMVQVTASTPPVTDGAIYDRIIGTGGDDDVNQSVSLGANGDGVGYLTETLPAVSATQTISKRLAFHGAGNGSIINGDVVFAAGSDGSSLKNLKIDGSITIDPGVKNLIVSDIWLTTGNTVTDNGTNNALTNIVVEE